jgi:AraC-like DNA-binding protein
MIPAAENMIRTTAPAGATTSVTSGRLVALLDAHGRPPDDLLAAAGVTRAQLDGPDAALPLDAFRELWARAHALQEDIGLALVEQFVPGQMHLLMHLAMRSATVGGAMEDVCRYAGVASPADSMALTRAGATARFAYRQRTPGPTNPWLVEHYFAMTMRFIAQACGRALPVRAVTFAAPAQAPLDAYRARFGVAPQFDAASNALVFDAEALAWPLLTQDAYLHAILERVAHARAAPTDDVADRVRHAIAQRLLTGAAPTLDAVAAACRLAPRTLRDRLARQGLGFRQLLDDVRRDLAREHLASGLSVNETAYLLGFSEPAAFQHACRRWFGVAAGEVRRQARL